MIEHHLISIEGEGIERIMLCTPGQAMLYKMQGFTVFDFTEDLQMEPEYYNDIHEVDVFGEIKR